MDSLNSVLNLVQQGNWAIFWILKNHSTYQFSEVTSNCSPFAFKDSHAYVLDPQWRLFFVCFCIEGSIGTRGGAGWLMGCFDPPTPTVVCSAGRSGAVSLCWSCFLLLCGLFCGAVCFSFAWCCFVLVIFSPLNMGLPR